MNVHIHRSDYFNHDFDLQYRWYLSEEGAQLADRYLNAVLTTLSALALQPGLSRPRNFRNPALRALRSFCVRAPSDSHLIFYRHTEFDLFAERIMHGARDLPRRLREPPSE
jgi:plasmid stabilization system protein ParE